MPDLDAEALDAAVRQEMVVMPGKPKGIRRPLPGAADLHWLSIHGVRKGLFEFRVRARRQAPQQLRIGQADGEQASRHQQPPHAGQTRPPPYRGQRAVGVARQQDQGEAPYQGEGGQVATHQADPCPKPGGQPNSADRKACRHRSPARWHDALPPPAAARPAPSRSPAPAPGRPGVQPGRARRARSVQVQAVVGGGRASGTEFHRGDAENAEDQIFLYARRPAPSSICWGVSVVE